jgi:esterase
VGAFSCSARRSAVGVYTCRVMLAHQRVPSGTGNPAAGTVLFLHGALGRGRNWRTVARRLVQARPEREAVLVDLRLHGDSRDLPGPHTLKAAADDVETLARSLDPPVRGVIGHSFGGKVALAWAARTASPLAEVWLLDSPPGARGEQPGLEDTLQVLRALEGVPYPVPSRQAFVDHLAKGGFSEGLAQWLATNLEHQDDGSYRLALDLGAIGELLADYVHHDLWAQVEQPGGTHHVHLVVGGRSRHFGPEDVTRAERAAASSPRVHLHLLPGAGHWLHMDAPDALLALLQASPPWRP